MSEKKSKELPNETVEGWFFDDESLGAIFESLIDAKTSGNASEMKRLCVVGQDMAKKIGLYFDGVKSKVAKTEISRIEVDEVQLPHFVGKSEDMVGRTISYVVRNVGHTSDLLIRFEDGAYTLISCEEDSDGYYEPIVSEPFKLPECAEDAYAGKLITAEERDALTALRKVQLDKTGLNHRWNYYIALKEEFDAVEKANFNWTPTFEQVYEVMKAEEGKKKQ